MIVDVKDASFGVIHGRAVLWLVDFSLSASTGLRDHFSQQVRYPFGDSVYTCGSHEILIDGLGMQQALLMSPSQIIEWRE
jgi:hypothetical protein